MDTPLVSIITPSYNQAAYLEATIKSVLEQDYPNIEYLVVDGVSEDGSAEIIQKYANELTWWVSEPDDGQADAINKGLRRAQGKYVAWLNSDDVYLPGAVKRAVDVFEVNPQAGLVYANLQSIDEVGKVFNTIQYQPYDLDDLLAFRMIGQPSVFMRREVLIQTVFLFPEYQYLLDHHLWVRMAAQTEMFYVNETWAAARHHPMAKNVAQAAGFGEEAYKLLAWAETRPKLAARIRANPKRVWGGAHRLDARYLLEGGEAWASLKSYTKAFKADARYTIKHWHRILYAGLSVVGLSWLRKIFNLLRPNG